MANIVEVLLRARDQVSPVIARMKGNIESLSSPINQVSTGLNSFMGGMGANLVSMGIAQVGQSIQQLTTNVQDASDFQVRSLSQAGDLAQQLKINFSDAKQLIEETQVALAAIAVELPGTNADYQLAFSQLSSISAKLSNGDVTSFKEISTNLAKRTALLSSIQGTEPGYGGIAISQAISGGRGLGELFQIDLFQRSSVLRDAIDDQLKAMGETRASWQKLELGTRRTIIESALKIAVSDDTLSAFDSTVSTQLASIEGKLFDQQTGVFGFLRKIPNVGGRSVIDAIQGFLQAWMNLSTTISEVGKKLGISFDPMEALIRLIDWFRDLGDMVNGYLNGASLGSFDGMFDSIGRTIRNMVNGFFGAFESLIDNTDWFALGSGLSKIGISILKGILDIDWMLVVRTIFKALILTPIEILSGALVNMGLEFINRLKNPFSLFDSQEQKSGVSGDSGGLAGFWDWATGKTQDRAYEKDLQNKKAAENQDKPKPTESTNILQVPDSSNSLQLPEVPSVLNTPQAPSVLNGSDSGEFSSPQALSSPKSQEVSSALQVPKVSGVLQVPQATQATGTRISNQAFAPVINVNGSKIPDMNQLAQVVLDRLNEQWNTYSANQLA
jgi:hypothetical protein